MPDGLQASRSFPVLSTSRVLSRQKAAAERAEGAQAHSELPGRRHVLSLDVSLDQGVFKLHCAESFPAMRFGQGLRSSDVPCGRIAETDIADLAGTDQAVER